MATSSSRSELVTGDILGHYLREIRHFTNLDAEHELRLAKRWADHRDQRAAERLVTSHLGLIVKIANGFRGYGLPLAELVAEGNVGMMQALERFDPDRGFRLSTYARWWIRAAILEYILRSWSMVRVCTTPGQKRLFFKLRMIKARLEAVDDGDLNPATVTTIANQLDVPEHEVVMMNRRLSGHDRSLNTPTSSDGESDSEWQDWLVDQAPDQETTLGDREEMDLRRGLLRRAMTQLNARERHILTARRLAERPLTLEDLACEYGVSRERIRQIEERAIRRIQDALGTSPPQIARSRKGLRVIDGQERPRRMADWSTLAANQSAA